MTLIEPAVEPAEPPKSISATSTTAANSPHALKSALARPVVVIIETVWKTACRTASSPAYRSRASSSTRSSTDPTASRPMYSRNSSSRTNTPGWRRSSARYVSAKFAPATAMKNTITHCDAAAKPSTERGSVEKPPVGMVEKACATAWNRFICSSTPVQPSVASSAISTTVSPT